MKTYTVKANTINRKWYLVDATNKILGHLASIIASILIGKHKPEYTPYIDTGDFIIVINATKILVTGKKYINKIYYNYSGYVGGIKKKSFKYMIEKNPVRIIELAVKGMLPKGPLGRAMYRKLKIYAQNEHKHIAQKPIFLNKRIKLYA